jgi:hypothetical protein
MSKIRGLRLGMIGPIVLGSTINYRTRRLVREENVSAGYKRYVEDKEQEFKQELAKQSNVQQQLVLVDAL